MASNRPHIVLIIAEHWRGDSLGCLGNPVAETPNLDELSAHGTTFTNAYSPCPSCIAARRSLMTGQTPDTHGMLGYQDYQPWPYTRTMAGELARSGYQTINVGKTHFHPNRLHLGYEELIVPEDYNEWIDAQTGLTRAGFAHGVHANSWVARPSHLPEVQNETTWLTEQAMKRIQKRDPERPFFLTLSFNAVHPPFCPPQCYYDMFKDIEMPNPMIGEWARSCEHEISQPPDVNAWRTKLSPEKIQRARVAYFAFIAYVDAQIGRFVEFLNRSRLGRDTFFLFTADHGEMLGDHHLWRKTYAYDPSARIPFIVRPPLSWKARRNFSSDALVGLEDIMPTFLESADVRLPESVEGKSVCGIISGESEDVREYYHHEHSECYVYDNAYQCITDKEWKYIWNPVTGAEQLFERKEDPYELNDLAPQADYADTLARYRGIMATHLKDRPEGLSDGESLTPNPVAVWRCPGNA